MARIKDKAKQIWISIVLPDGVDEDYDRACDEAFLRFLDKVYIISWTIFGCMASISIYLLITKELL